LTSAGKVLDDDEDFARPKQSELLACDRLDRSRIGAKLARFLAQRGVFLPEEPELRLGLCVVALRA
jgi:hypothetical protein